MLKVKVKIYLCFMNYHTKKTHGVMTYTTMRYGVWHYMEITVLKNNNIPGI
jgi:hypothetical protein